MTTQPNRAISGPWPPETTDPADLFVLLYDALPERVAAGRQMSGWFTDADFWVIADEIIDRCLTHGTVDADRVAELLENQGDDRHLVAILAGLDEALLFASPFVASHEQGKMLGHRDHYLETGRFNEKTTGGLLPRRTYPGRPRSAKEKGDYFRVVRVPEAAYEQGFDNKTSISTNDPWFAPNEQVRIGFVPVLDSYDDVDFTFTPDKDTAAWRYSISPRESVADRLEKILNELDGCGAHVAVLPESCLSTDLQDHWLPLIRRRPPSRKSSLRWMLLGSGPVDGPGNRAVLVDRWGGVELLRQDKMSDFTLTGHQIQTWGIPGAPPELQATEALIQEDIELDVDLLLLDCFLGRLGVMICESLHRWPGSARLSDFLHAGPSHILAPVFSRPMTAADWAGGDAQQLSGLLGPWVMVSNSLAVPVGTTTSINDIVTSSVCGPFQGVRNSYRISQQYGCSVDSLTAARVVTDSLVRTSDLPSVLSAALFLSWFPEITDQDDNLRAKKAVDVRSYSTDAAAKSSRPAAS